MAKAAKVVDDQIFGEIKELTLDRFAVRNMRVYGKYTIEHRAIPDFRDGLKPVQRRALWSMHEQKINSSGGFKKAARVVGDVIAKYNPHGDLSVYDAMVNMVNAPMPLIEGSGNWGEYNTAAAHYRYSECRLSKYTDAIMFSPAYMDVSEMVNNFDGSEKEPLVLPALLPNLLINGVQGLAVGVTVGIPPFKIKGVSKLVEIGLSENELKEKHFQKYLEINYKFGGTLLDPNRLKIFLSTGESAITLLPDYTYNADENIITITGAGPNFEVKWAVARLQEFDIVTNVDRHSSSGGLKLVVHLRNTDQARNSVELLMRKLADSLTLRCNLTRRISNDDVEFFAATPLEYLKMWIKWRLELESKAQLQIAANLDKQIKQTDLLILANKNWDKISKEISAKKEHLAERLAAALKIPLDDAKYLAQRALGSFAALNTDKLIALNKTNSKLSAAAKAIAQSPTNEVLATTKRLVEQI